MSKPEILIAGPLRRIYIELLQNAFQTHLYWLSDDKDQMLAEVSDNIRGMVAVAGFNIDNDLIDRLRNLEVISNYGVGFDNIDIDHATLRGVRVSNTPDAVTNDTADLGVILMLNVLRDIVTGHKFVAHGDWPIHKKFDLSISPKGKTLGILGLGRIGRAIATKAEVFGMDIIYHGRSKKPDVDYLYFESLIEMAKQSDVLMVACEGGEKTRHLVNADVLKALGPNGYIVNIARGTVIDEQALIKSLQSDEIAGAGLDVFENEPHVPEALYNMPNVVLQPHRGTATIDARQDMADDVVQNLKSWFNDKKVITPVN